MKPAAVAIESHEQAGIDARLHQQAMHRDGVIVGVAQAARRRPGRLVVTDDQGETSHLGAGRQRRRERPEQGEDPQRSRRPPHGRTCRLIFCRRVCGIGTASRGCARWENQVSIRETCSGWCEKSAYTSRRPAL